MDILRRNKNKLIRLQFNTGYKKKEKKKSTRKTYIRDRKIKMFPPPLKRISIYLIHL